MRSWSACLAVCAMAACAGSAAAAGVRGGARSNATDVNMRPIIGILTDPNPYTQWAGQSYFPASYVKWIESGGGRVVPVPYTLDETSLRALAAQLNGFLFTGGGTEFWNPDNTLTQFARSAQIIMDVVMQANDAGEYVPLWGTCQGFELIAFLGSGPVFPTVLASGFDSENLTLPLTPTSAAAGSRFFTAAHAAGVDQILFTEPVTMNNHQMGVTPTTFANNKNLTRLFGSALTTNVDREGRPFVSTYEGITYPIYATQWHPEKVQFEWDPLEGINHSFDSVAANSFTARFFVEEARKNTRAFATPSAEAAALIYNYNPVYTGTNPVSSFTQCYFFN